MPNIILATTSPRRIEIFKTFNIPFTILPSQYEENIDESKPQDLVIKLAKGKALSVINKISDDNTIIIAADTIVTIDSKLIGKPSTKNDAYNILKSLSGKKHEVYTGLYLYRTKDNFSQSDYVKTEVFFNHLSEEEITDYIETNEPMDKAGAYGIQGYGALFVNKIVGDYFNVVGLPVSKLYNMLRVMGVNLLKKEV